MIVVKLREVMQQKGIRFLGDLIGPTGLSQNSLGKIARGEGFRMESIDAIDSRVRSYPSLRGAQPYPLGFLFPD